MIKEFVPYQESLELKELGFDEPCICMYNSYEHLKGVIVGSIDGDYIKKDKWDERLPAPLYQQTFRWFREKHNLVHRIDKEGGWWVCAILDLYDEKDQGTIEIYLEDCYPNSYEEAELACLRKVIEIVKGKQS